MYRAVDLSSRSHSTVVELSIAFKVEGLLYILSVELLMKTLELDIGNRERGRRK